MTEIETAGAAGAGVVILAGLGLLAHAATHHPGLRLKLSMPAAADADAVSFSGDTFGVARVVLPHVLSVPEIAVINAGTEAETEAFVFFGLCVKAVGRCSMSSWATGILPNMNGACSPSGTSPTSHMTAFLARVMVA